MSTSAEAVRFSSGRYLHELLGGNHGEMDQDDPYLTFVAQVAARVRERRETEGWSRDELGRRLGVQGATVLKWETVRGALPLKHAGRLAEALEIPWQQLLGLAPMPARVRDPLEELANVVEGLAKVMESGTADVVARLVAIERRLLALDGGGLPRGGGKPASGGEA